uniref:ferredoxin:thioredoxin reductase n=1 Tax=Vischeria sp. CAUP Q 202 TaxID=1805947 RepID=A0A3R5V0A3_9STRA|nr:plastid ferredoxin-thioredoxin reductase beta subunit [Vischeria sp. CAUP Q 202]
MLSTRALPQLACVCLALCDLVVAFLPGPAALRATIPAPTIPGQDVRRTGELVVRRAKEEPAAEGSGLSVSMKAMQKFAEKYCDITDTYFCSDLEITATVIKGLALHKDELGAPLCPCRHYEDKQAEVNLAYWNCPCVPMRERKECHCMLFLTKDNAFVGKDQRISEELLKEPQSAAI